MVHILDRFVDLLRVIMTALFNTNHALSKHGALIVLLILFPAISALIVRFLTKRFIGDYEANTGKIFIQK
jgi:hypothetical protein